jgi:hypothetical protein
LKRDLYTLDDFIKNIHRLGYTIVDLNDIKIPVLYIDKAFFNQILKISYNRKISIDTNLNIYDDGHHIFIDLTLKFLNTELEDTYLLYANKTLGFFYNLANSGMIGLAPFGDQSHNIFFIQLPKKDQAEKAYEMITEKIKESQNN